jgi:hypothetical protein
MRDERTPGKPEAPSAELVLAAIDRAITQQFRPVPDTSADAIAQHLALSRRSGLWRQVRRRLLELEDTGELQKGRRNGLDVWTLTAAGRERLTRAVRAGRVPVLPDSPQRERWRDARRLAAAEAERFTTELSATLEEGQRMLGEPSLTAADWLTLAGRLKVAAERVGAVTFCLHEWPEPQDDGPDTSGGPKMLHLARFGETL